MYKFGKTSRARLDTCDPRLIEILEEAIKIVDFTVLCGERTEEEQRLAVTTGASKVSYPNSMHNHSPSLAVDIAPYPIDWKDISRFAHLGGIIRGIAQQKGIKIRCGFDWDGDGNITDHKFMDWPHIELV